MQGINNRIPRDLFQNRIKIYRLATWEIKFSNLKVNKFLLNIKGLHLKLIWYLKGSFSSLIKDNHKHNH